MEFERSENCLIVRLEGEITSENTPQIVGTLFSETDGIDNIVFDLEQLEYISSAGLRMFIALQKLMKNNMTIKNANEEIIDIFRVSGLMKVLNIADGNQ